MLLLGYVADEKSAGFAGLCNKAGEKPIVWRGKKKIPDHFLF
jgi:hypothetical protein